MQLYVGDYLKDTRHLTAEQHGAYLLLLMSMWANGGDLPNDPKKLARLASCTASRWAKISDDVLAFFEVDGDVVTQARLRVELKKAQEKSIKRAEAGTRGGEAKSLKDNKADLANASGLPCHSSEPEPDTPPEDKSSVGDAQARKPGFEVWWEAYPAAVAKPKARAAYAYAVSRLAGSVVCPHATLLDGLSRSIASARWADPTYTIPNPARWLSEDRWLDGDKPPEAGAKVVPFARPTPIDDDFMAKRRAILRGIAENA